MSKIIANIIYPFVKSKKWFRKLCALLFIMIMLSGCGKVAKETGSSGSNDGSYPPPVITVTPDAQTTLNYTDTGSTINILDYSTENVTVKSIYYDSHSGGQYQRVNFQILDRWSTSPFIVDISGHTVTCNANPLNITAGTQNISVWVQQFAPPAEDFAYVYKLRLPDEHLSKVTGNYIKVYKNSKTHDNLIFYREMTSF